MSYPLYQPDGMSFGEYASKIADSVLEDNTGAEAYAKEARLREWGRKHLEPGINVSEMEDFVEYSRGYIMKCGGIGNPSVFQYGDDIIKSAIFYVDPLGRIHRLSIYISEMEDTIVKQSELLKSYHHIDDITIFGLIKFKITRFFRRR